MSDAQAASAPPVPNTEHSRVLLANNKAMRAIAPRLLGVIQDHVWDRHFMQVMAPVYGSDG